jgi:glycosidase
MENNRLQLMLYGRNIGKLLPGIVNDDVKIVDILPVPNKNYLFLDLEIKEGAKAKQFDILLYGQSGVVARKNYELKERRKNSSSRATFSSKDVMYLITPDRFANGNPDNDEIRGMKEGLAREVEYGRHGGDIQGIIDNLDYIKEMGFTAIWINPLTENDQDDWSYHGYATTDYYKIDRRFGSNEDYLKLSKLAKEKGMGIIMDQIANHCGHQHWWMADPPTTDWINYQDQEPKTFTNHRKFSLLDPYAAPKDREIMTHGWFVKTMPDLNQRNPLMSTYLIQNSIWWIEYADLYGIRQDTYSYPFKEFMTDWTCAIEKEYPGFTIVGEEWVDDPGIISYWQKGKENPDGYTSCLKSVMDFPMNVALAKALNEPEVWGKGLVRLYEILGKDYHYHSPMELVIMADNHDMSRIYEQVEKDIPNFQMAMAYILTMRGIPQIYYGTEILMDHPGTDSHGMIRSDFPGGWKGDTKNGFTGRGLTTQEKEAKEFMKNLLNWRKENSTIHNGQLMHFEPQKGVYVYFRYTDKETVMVVLNKNEKAITLDLSRFNRFVKGSTKAKEIISGKKITLDKELTLTTRGPQIFVF